MNDGVIWSCELDFVSRFSDWEKEKDPLWSINLHERLALAELNIPTFFHLVDECKIINSRSLDLTSLSIPGLQRAVNRLSNLNKDEVNWQIEIIKASTVGMIAYNENLEEGDYFQINDSIEGSDLFLINEARAIVKTLEATAFRSNGRASWIGLDWIDGSNNSQISPMSNDLYNGVVGISLFLIAYGKETGSRDAINLGLDGISRLRDSLRGANAERIARGMGIGGVSGLGSIVYTFTVISDLLDDEGILDDARNAAKLFTNDLINTDKKLDFLAGSAGAILGLLKLYRSSKEQWILDRAIECGNYLLSQPRNELSGKISWNCSGVSSLPLNGISHGAAGFAYALSSLARATGINKYEVAAAECIDYENSSFNSQTFNWPDFRKGVPAKDVEKICQWCHGGVGIGLARLGIKKNGIGDHEILMHDVSEALNGVYETGRKPQDSLCCGELGRIEFIYEAGKNANNQAIIDDAKKLLCNVIKTAHSQGEYRFGGGAQNFHLSFFRGLSGVGYSILRQLNPNLPYVLILE
jgi:type 2 lantibiotic biosynthesis protein LanM